MNWKLFGTMTALIGVGTSIALAQGTAPTIVQGDYISNVFGNSNFVKNPNAKLNTKDVTNATRSIATPLVATSEFNLNLTSGTFATWTLRAFDAGMKGQNCEARFSYRGFATATTKAEIVQNSLVVAHLTLTPSTDPRIASINFPCGDLAHLTTFRIAQTTAAMTGTNEIGGIYVGLATNMANVAQAEEVGSYTQNGVANCVWGTSSLTLANFAADADCNIGTVTGAADTSAGKIPGVKFNNLKPGKYMFVVSHTVLRLNAIADSFGTLITDGTTKSNQLLGYLNSATDFYSSATHVLMTEYTTVTSPTVQVQAFVSNASMSLQIPNNTSDYRFRITAYRFPSSSELVVTPERQNTWAGVSAYGGGATAVTAAAWTNLNESGAVTRSFYGKASAPSTAGDVAIKIASLPVGTYSVTFTGQADTTSAASAETQCLFGITDGTSRPAVTTQSAVGDTTTAAQRITASSFSSIFTNTAVQDKTFTVQAYRAGGTGSCGLYADVNRPYLITVTPLDQPSNSALYVQGPVKAAQTGAAIPAGYVGELKYAITSSSTNWPVTSGNWATLNSVVLPIGVWSCTGTVSFYRNAATFAGTTVNYMQANFSDVSGASSNYSRGFSQTTFELAIPVAFDSVSLPIRPITLRSNGSQIIWPDGTARGTTTLYLNSFLYNWTAGTPQHVNVIECTRLN